MKIDKFEDPDNSLIALIGFVAFVAFIALELSQSKVSIMANIAEGFSRKGNKEFIQFLFIAKSSAAELQSHLYVAMDQGYISNIEFKEIYEQADKIQR